MKLNIPFFVLLLLLLLLSILLYYIQHSVLREGLTSDKNPAAVKEAQVFQNDLVYGTKSSYIKILPLQNAILKTKTSGGILGSYPDLTVLPISQYTIKSSYNSACSGSSGNISNEMLMYTLSRGCRFIDFEIVNVSGVPYVVSPNYSAVVNIDKTKIVSLDNMLKTAVTYGMTGASGSAPNYKDPLFIHLRIRPDPNYKNLYKDIAASIQQNVGSSLYTQKGNSKLDIQKTKMSEIMGKIIILLDANYDPNWRASSACEKREKNCIDLNTLVHLETGIGNSLINSPVSINNQSQTPILIGIDGLSSMNTNMQVVLPDSDMAILKDSEYYPDNDKVNPDFSYLVTTWSCNFITNRFYIKDVYLRDYEDFFNDQQSAIVPLSYVKKYYTEQQMNNITG